jgi:hypothetical protein
MGTSAKHNIVVNVTCKNCPMTFKVFGFVQAQRDGSKRETAQQTTIIHSMMKKNSTLVVYLGAAACVSYAHSIDNMSKSIIAMLAIFRITRKSSGHGKDSKENMPKD